MKLLITLINIILIGFIAFWALLFIGAAEAHEPQRTPITEEKREEYRILAKIGCWKLYHQSEVVHECTETKVQWMEAVVLTLSDDAIDTLLH